MASSPSPPGPDTRERRDQRLFEDIASAYCRKDLLPASLRARCHRLQQTLKAVPSTARPEMLEVGCGAGFSAAYLAGCYGAYVGIDYAEPFIAYARQHNQRHGATFEVGNIKTYRSNLDLPVNSNRRFDVVFMIGVLHHIEQLEEALPGGYPDYSPGTPVDAICRVHSAATGRRRVWRRLPVPLIQGLNASWDG